MHVSAPSLHAHAHMTALTAPTLPQRSPFAIQELLGLGSQSESPPAPPASSSFGAGGSLGAAPHLLYSRHAALAAHQQHSLFPDSRHVWMNPALLPGMGVGGLGGPVTPVTMNSAMPSMLGLRHDAHAAHPDAHSPGESTPLFVEGSAVPRACVAALSSGRHCGLLLLALVFLRRRVVSQAHKSCCVGARRAAGRGPGSRQGRRRPHSQAGTVT